MVAAAWNDIPGTTIRASWRKLYKSNDETSTALHDADRRGSSTNPTSTDQPEPIDLPPVEDFLYSLRNIHGCNECDITDEQEWIQMDSSDQGYELLNDEQIISVIQSNNDDDDDDENLTGSAKTRHNSTFFDFLFIK